MKYFTLLASGLAILAALTLSSGCGGRDGGKPKGDKNAAKDSKNKDDHDHGEGPHGGAVGDWGGGKYHVEFLVDHDKKEATVYILGDDQKTLVPIKASEGRLALSIKGLKNKDEYKVVLKAEPQKGDPEGKASRFVGKDDRLGVEQEYAGTVDGVADGTPYTGKFVEKPAKK